jgi:hypothetical protein
MASVKPIGFLALGLAIALAGFFAIGFACRYGLVATIMTGQIILPGLPFWLPYKRILSIAVCLILYAIYLWARGRAGSEAANKSLAIAIIGVGVAAVGFLSVSYPCPYGIGLSMLLHLEIYVGEFGFPYWILLAVAAGLLLYAAFVRTRSTPRPERSP